MIALLNLINHQPKFEKIFLYLKDTYGPKYHLLINNKKNWVKYLKDPKPSIKHLSDMNDVYKSIEVYNLGKKTKSIDSV